MESDRLILTPEDPGFHEILYGSFPPGWRSQPDFAAFIVRSDRGGILAPASESDLDEYLGGGEYDTVLEEDDVEQFGICIPEPEVGFFFA
jgi:hypothetical protein